MNIGTILRTILVTATCLNTALLATDVTQFGNEKLDTIYKVLSVILNFIIVACATYFNNDFTKTACEATGEMRAKKAEKKKGAGEHFYDDPDSEPEEDENHE